MAERDRKRYRLPIESFEDTSFYHNSQTSSNSSQTSSPSPPVSLPVLVRGDFSFGPNPEDGLLLNSIPRMSPTRIAHLLENEGMSLVGKNAIETAQKRGRPASDIYGNVKLPPIRNNFAINSSNSSRNSTSRNSNRQSIPDGFQLSPMSSHRDSLSSSSTRSVPSGLNNLANSSPGKPRPMEAEFNEDFTKLPKSIQSSMISKDPNAIQTLSSTTPKPSRDFWHAQCVFYNLPAVGSSKKLMENLWKELWRDPLSLNFSNRENPINSEGLKFSGQLKLLEDDLRREWERKYQELQHQIGMGNDSDDDEEMDLDGIDAISTEMFPGKLGTEISSRPGILGRGLGSKLSTSRAREETAWFR